MKMIKKIAKIPPSPQDKIYEEAKEVLEKIQQYDANTLVQYERLGKELNFEEVIPAAQQLIDFYTSLPSSVLNFLPAQQVKKVMQQVQKDLDLLDSIMQFSIDGPGKPRNLNSPDYNIRNERQRLVNSVKSAYQVSFNELHPIISYAIIKTTDVMKLVEEADEFLGMINGDIGTLREDIEMLNARIGITKQASYFGKTQEDHELKANYWLYGIICMTLLLLSYTVFSFFLHTFPQLKTENAYDTAQLAVSKAMVFGVLTYLLYLTVKNFMAHQHNAEINRHRHNALMTFEYLVDAAKDAKNKEVILNHAAACMFAPQQTGYSGNSSEGGPAAKSIVELIGGGFGSE